MNWALVISLLPAILAELAKTFPSSGAIPEPAASVTLLGAQSVFIKHAQEVMNAVQNAGLVSFGASLKADGVAGPKTNAAMQALLNKFGIVA